MAAALAAGVQADVLDASDGHVSSPGKASHRWTADRSKDQSDFSARRIRRGCTRGSGRQDSNFQIRVPRPIRRHGALSRHLQKEGHFVQAVALGSGARSNRKWLSGRVAEGWQKECRSASPCSKSAAARRALREALVTSPQEISNLIEAAMAGDMTASTPGAGAPQLTSTRAWLEHRSRVQAFPTMVHMSWAIGGTLDCLRAGKVDQARARLNIAVLIVDQVSIDKGSWLLAQELSLEVGPPMSSFRKHEVASSAGDPAYSRLLDPRWAEVALAKLREEADFLDRRQKLSSRRRGQLK